MFRVSLNNGFGRPISRLLADEWFVLEDDLTTSRSDDQGRASTQVWDAANTPNQPHRRQSEGRYSWMATLTPHVADTSTIFIPQTDTYILAIVLFVDRPSDLSVLDPLHERVVEACVLGTGAAGGEVLLHWSAAQNVTNDKAAAAILKLRTGNWLMLAANSTPGVFRWYRVTDCTPEILYEPSSTSTFSGPGYQVYATLQGPDWNLHHELRPSNPGVLGRAEATLIEGVVAVQERTIQLHRSTSLPIQIFP
jgi:hypothetical protein